MQNTWWQIMLRAYTYFLVLVLGFWGYKFLFGADNVMQLRKLKTSIAEQQAELAGLQGRNLELVKKIENLKKYPLSIEEQARLELGMVKKGEKYYQVVEPIK